MCRLDLGRLFSGPHISAIVLLYGLKGPITRGKNTTLGPIELAIRSIAAGGSNDSRIGFSYLIDVLP